MHDYQTVTPTDDTVATPDIILNQLLLLHVQQSSEPRYKTNSVADSVNIEFFYLDVSASDGGRQGVTDLYYFCLARVLKLSIQMLMWTFFPSGLR